MSYLDVSRYLIVFPKPPGAKEFSCPVSFPEPKLNDNCCNDDNIVLELAVRPLNLELFTVL